MRRQDALFIAAVAMIFSPFFFSGAVLEGYRTFNLEHGIITGAVKLAILATLSSVGANRDRAESAG